MSIVIIFVVLIILVVAAFIACDHLFYSSFLRRAEQIRNEAGIYEKKLFSEDDIAEIPPPVAKFIVFSGFTGKKILSSVHIKHSGTFRAGPDKRFVPIKGEYFLTTKRPSFCWFGTIKMKGGLKVSAFDSYFNGHGRMLIKIMSFFKIADARTPETSLSALGRCVAELTMAPTFFLNKEHIRWTAYDAEKAYCTVTDAGLSVNARMYFHPEGALDRIEIDRLYDRGKGRFTTERFTGRVSVIKDYNGLKLASVIDGYWNLPEGDLHYVHFRIEEVMAD